jgi:hypothetical protein
MKITEHEVPSGTIPIERVDEFPPVRISPDMRNVAIRTHPEHEFPWRVSNGGWYTDAAMADWLMLELDPDSIEDGFGL